MRSHFPLLASLLLVAPLARAASYEAAICVSQTKACLDSPRKVYASVAHTCWDPGNNRMEARLLRDGEVVDSRAKGGVREIVLPLSGVDFPDLSAYIDNTPGNYGFAVDAVAYGRNGNVVESETAGTETVRFCRWFSATVTFCDEGCPRPFTVTLDRYSDNYDGTPTLAVNSKSETGFSIRYEPTEKDLDDGSVTLHGTDAEWDCDYSAEIPLEGCDPDKEPGTTEVKLGSVDISVFAAKARNGGTCQTATLRVKADEWDDALLTRASVKAELRDAVPGGNTFTVALRSAGGPADSGGPIRCQRDEGGLRLVEGPDARVALTNYPSGGYEIVSFSKRTGARLWSVSVEPFLPDGADTNAVRGLRVTESIADREPRSWNYLLEAIPGGAAKTWSLVSAGLVAESEAISETSPTTRTIRRRVADPATGAVASDTLTEERLFDWGWSRIAETLDPAGAALRTAWAYAEQGAGRYGRVTNVVDRQGSATSTEYDAQGRVARTASPTPAGLHVVQNAYAPVDARDDGSVEPSTPRSVVETIGGIVTARRWTILFENDGIRTRVTETAASQASPRGASANARETRVSYSPARLDRLSGREIARVAADGLVRTNAYSFGVLSSSAPDPADWSFTPSGGGSTNAVLRVETWTAPPNVPGGIPRRTAADVSYIDPDGRTVFSETRVVTGNGTSARVSWTATAFDALGRPLVVRRSDGSRVETAYGRFGAVSATDAAGRTTATEYDALGRVTRATETGGGRPALVTETAYDASGRVVSTVVSSGGLVQTNSVAYDLAGRETRRVSSDGIEQRTDYGRLGDTVFYWTRTVRAPAPGRCAAPDALSSTNTSYVYKCGKAAWTEFNGRRRETYAYGVNADGTQWRKTSNGPGGAASPSWTLSTDAFLGGGSACCGGGGGRTAVQSRPGANGSVLTTTYEYDKGGRVVSETVASSRSGVLSRTLRAFDALGERAVEASDLDLDGAIGFAGPDRVSSNATAYVYIDGDWWRESRAYSFPLDGDSTPVLTGLTRQRLTGLGSGGAGGSPAAASSGGAGGSPAALLLASETVSVDALGNATTNRVWRDRANGASLSETLSPASSLASWSLSVGGLVLTNRSSTGVLTSQTHDALGRTLAATDGRGNTTTYAYDAYGNLVSETDATGAVTTYTYDALNRRAAVMQNAQCTMHNDGGTTSNLSSLTSNPSTTYTAYDAEDRVVAQWGATYPVLYAYDAFGRLSSLSTTRDEGAAGQLATDHWPLATDASGVAWDTTRWNHDDATGLLTNKVYADGLGPSYAYTDDGKLATRTWARGIVTSYSYDLAGNLTSVMHNAQCMMQNGGGGSDSSLVTRRSSLFSYDRIGRMRSAIVPGVSTNYYSYSIHGQLTNEVQNGVSIARTYDSLARPTGYILRASVPLCETVYSYDSLGRFSGVGFNAEAQSGGVDFDYSYLPGTDLVSGYTAGDFSRSVTYEPHRNLIAVVTNSLTPAGETFNLQLSTFNYSNDALGRRCAVTRSGAAFGALSGATDSYGYNDRNEVISSRRTLGGAEVRGFDHDYAYDPIGNRVTSATYDEQGEAQTSAYTANALNQYTQRTVPGNVQVRGESDPDAVVTVNGNPAWRNGAYFYGGDYADNDGFPVFRDVAVEAVMPAPTPDDYEEIAAVTGKVFVAATPEQFTYDADGNMTSDGRFQYTWNAENRLVLAQELCAPTNRFPYTVSYAYDHKGRMVRKDIRENDGSDTLVKSVSYLWDGWNIIREIQWPVASGQWPVVTDNVWGLDLDGTLQGAGGVGGLLAVVRSDCAATNSSLFTLHSSLYFPTYDANGNISEYVTTNGEIVAHYDYSPFGETLMQTGGLAASFTHRFSTKPWCPVTGLCEYQMRKYKPEIGRWLSRDPIGERNYKGLYKFCLNPIGYYDSIGMFAGTIGFSFDAGGSTGISLSFAIGVSYSRKKGLKFGIVTAGSTGSFVGLGASIDIQMSFSTTAPELSSLEGPSMIVGGSGGEGIVFGASVGIPLDAENGYAVLSGNAGLGVGSIAEGHVYVSRTLVWDWCLINGSEEKGTLSDETNIELPRRNLENGGQDAWNISQ